MENQPSSVLLGKIRDTVDDPQDRALLDELAKAIRNSSLNDKFDDETFIKLTAEMQMGLTWPPKWPPKLPPTNDRTSRVSITYPVLEYLAFATDLVNTN